jgi:hypothetical protein
MSKKYHSKNKQRGNKHIKQKSKILHKKSKENKQKNKLLAEKKAFWKGERSTHPES